MDLFLPVRFKTTIQLPASDLGELGVSFEKTLLDKLKATHETICTRFGYIRRGSLRILKRSAGNFVKQHFNGYTKFELLCRAEVCNPAKGSVYEAVVGNKNALGLRAEALSDGVPVLDIIIPKRAAGIQSEIALDDLQAGDTVYVKVLGKKYQLNDRFISIIGCAVKKPGLTGAAASAEAAAMGALTEGEFAEGAEEGELAGGGGASDAEESDGGSDAGSDAEADGSDAEDGEDSAAATSEYEDDYGAAADAGAATGAEAGVAGAAGVAADALLKMRALSVRDRGADGDADDDYDGGDADADADDGYEDDSGGDSEGGSDDDGDFFRD